MHGGKWTNCKNMHGLSIFILVIWFGPGGRTNCTGATLDSGTLDCFFGTNQISLFEFEDLCLCTTEWNVFCV